MKIAMVGQKGFPATYGGIERHVEELSRRLAQRGHDVSVYSRTHYSRSKGTTGGVRLIRHPSLKTKHLDAVTHSSIATFDALFRDFDIVHYHALGPSIFSMMPTLSIESRISSAVRRRMGNRQNKSFAGSRSRARASPSLLMR